MEVGLSLATHHALLVNLLVSYSIISTGFAAFVELVPTKKLAQFFVFSL
jgi:hypothetical protein